MQTDSAVAVYYISNLVLMWKYKDALKVIENFGDKLKCKIAKANILRLHGLIYMHDEKKPKEAYKKFVEARNSFSELGVTLGVALCYAALGFLLYTKVVRLNF